MSLLDDVSIVVTPNGYKAGELYAVIPVPSEGAEEITNGDFATDSDWTKGTGWSISGGTANCIGGAGSLNLTQVALEIGKRYTVTYTVSNYSTGTIHPIIGGWTHGTYQSSNGTYTEVISNNHASANTTFYMQGKSGFVGSIDNVSVKEYTSADMDVTRATAATRVDEDGLVNYAEVIGSEEVTNGDFATDSDWSKGTGWSISGGTAILDGTQTGGSSLSSSNMTVTVGKIYKVTVNVSATSSGFRLYDALGVVSYGLSLGENIFYRTPSSSTYTLTPLGLGGATGTISNVSVKEAARDNVPRIDYTGGGCPHILAEPQRTNLVTYSEDYTVYSLTRTTITSGYGTSPNGGQNSTAIFNTTETGGHNLNGIYFSVTSGTSYVNSVFAKAGTITKMKLRMFSGGGTLIGFNDGVFDLTNGTATGVGASIESYGNGWYRCYMIDSPTSSVSNARFNIGLLNADGDSNYTGLITDYIEVFGSEVSVGSYATSYIPTSGSTVTRNQDIFTRDGIGSLINSTEGVLFVEMAALSNDGTFRQLSLNDGTTANRILVDFTDTSNQIRVFCGSGGVSQVSETFNVTNSLSFNKIAFKYKLNDFALWVNGVEVATDTSGITPIGLNKLSFNNGSGSFDFFGKVKQLQVYNTALTDTQLAALTS